MANYVTDTVSSVTTELESAGVDPEVLELLTSILTEEGGGNVAKAEVTDLTTLTDITAGTRLVEITLPATTTQQVVDLKALDKAAVADMKAIVLSGDAPVTATITKEFAGVVVLGNGDNKVTAKGSNDITVQTGTGSDSVKLAGGSDSVVLAGGSDSVKSGAGDDQITVSEAGADDEVVIAAGGGNDTVDLSDVSIASVTKVSGFTQITLDNGAVIRVKGVEDILYTDADNEVQEVGIKAFRDIDFDGL
jgi:hypothetical protein